MSLGVGAVLGEAYKIVFRNFLSLLAVMAAPFLAIIIVGAVIFGAAFLQTSSDPEAFQSMMEGNPETFWMLYGVFMIFAMFLGSFMYAALIQAIFDAKSGSGVRIGKALRTGVSRCVQLFVNSIVLWLLIAIGIGVVVGLLAVVGLPTVAAVIVGVLMIYLIGLTAPFATVTVVENLWLSSIARTIRLTKGYRWPIIGLFILYLLTAILVSVPITLLSVGANMAGTIGMVVGVIVQLLGSVVIYGSGFAVMTLIYVRLREIKEGTSAESLVEIFS